MYMDESKKAAIKTLNRLFASESITEDEYFNILSYVMEEKTGVTYVPPQQIPQTTPTYPMFPTFPWTTWYGEQFKYEITCHSAAGSASERVMSMKKNGF